MSTEQNRKQMQPYLALYVEKGGHGYTLNFRKEKGNYRDSHSIAKSCLGTSPL